jgi:hypothetical protein
MIKERAREQVSGAQAPQPDSAERKPLRCRTPREIASSVGGRPMNAETRRWFFPAANERWGSAFVTLSEAKGPKL